ncbi:bacillithiol system redox-active protein YtxJ [Spongiimicrobium salis]|uniref:bacillithiol system redox-active protein YtxJ n=1 Tax=Spongiimicrobium salis TaxID=1667022 RepID=UPI00374DE6D4
MGLFGGLFGSGNTEKKERKVLPWQKLERVSQLDEIIKRSKGKTQLIYKHSTTCGISKMVLNMFTEAYDFTEEQLDIYYLDLHSYREVSNETGYKFQVMHQSPQILLIKNGTVVAHASHGAIMDVALEKYV